MQAFIWRKERKRKKRKRERKVNDEAGEVPEYMVSARMERLLELTRDYEPAISGISISGIWMKQVVFSRHCLKKRQAKGGKKSKTRLTIALLLNAAGEKVIEPLVIWRSDLVASKTLKIVSVPM